MPSAIDKSRLIDAFEIQAGWCTRLGSPFTARLLTQAANDLRTEGALMSLIQDYPLDPVDSMLALRVAGAFNALVIAGTAPDLAAFYPAQCSDPDPAALWRAAAAVLVQHRNHFHAYLERAVQTNEMRRCTVLLGGFATAQAHHPLPLRLLEIGASAGLNLLWDSYAYALDLDTGETLQWGVDTSPLRLSAAWKGTPPPLPAAFDVSARAGCDLNAVDLSQPEDYRRALSYIWPDQFDRVERFKAAARLVRERAIRVDSADAGDWLNEHLNDNVPGVLSVVFHSYVWPYFSADTAAAVIRALDAAGARATADAPLAWLRMEPADSESRPALLLTLWPGGETRRLAWCHPHGLKARWEEERLP